MSLFLVVSGQNGHTYSASVFFMGNWKVYAILPKNELFKREAQSHQVPQFFPKVGGAWLVSCIFRNLVAFQTKIHQQKFQIQH